MTLKECYQLLHVDQSASLEEVKRAYRRRAFELHPDLNPNVSDANRQFQRLNEAYVILNRLVAAREAAAAESAARQAAGQQDVPRPGSRWYDWSFSFGGGKKAEPEQEPPRESHEERRAQREEAYREEIRREEERLRQHRQEEDRRREEMRKAAERRAEQRAEQARAEKDRTEQPDQPQTERPPRPGSAKANESSAQPAGPAGGDNLYAEQQEVLRDILNDDFARRVFEDIYSEIRKKGPPPTREEFRPQGEASPQGASSQHASPSRTESVQAESVPQKSKGGLPFGLDQFKLDFSAGVGNTVRGWLRGQIDEEQTIRLPATGLHAGGRVRLQIRRGLADGVTTIEVTLPPDFVVGKPIRLRGMGKKLGSMQGDLYLTVLAK